MEQMFFGEPPEFNLMMERFSQWESEFNQRERLCRRVRYFSVEDLQRTLGVPVAR
jgi:hypothetical protein